MKPFVVLFTLIAFCASPAVCVAAPAGAYPQAVHPENIYKQTYITLMTGAEPGEALRQLVAATKSAGLTVKDVLEATVRRGWMTQDQMDSILEAAAKNRDLLDHATAEKALSGKLSVQELKSLSSAMQGRVTGAAYWCNRCGCYQGYMPYIIGSMIAALLVMTVIITVLLD